MERMAAKTETAREAWKYLHDFLFSEANHERVLSACTSVGLTPGLMKALLSIEPGQPIAMRALPDRWHCDASYVTLLVDGLEGRRLVERRAHPTDRRAKTIVLTSEGEHTRNDLLRRLHEPPPSFAALTHAEQRTLRDLLRKLAVAAEGGYRDRSSA
jgi:DNA-binding MarR family transcriptional regulator